MAIAGMRVYEVIDSGITKQKPEEEPRAWFALPQRKDESPEGKDRGCEEGRIVDQIRGFRRTRPPGPVIHESFKADPGEASVIGANEIQRLALTFSDVRHLSYLFILLKSKLILRRMQIGHPGAVRTR